MKSKAIILLLATIVCWQQSQSQTKSKPAPIGCSTIEPQKTFKLDTTDKTRGLADNYYLWDNGQTIYVKMMSGSDAQKQMIERYAKEWERYGNIFFTFVSSGPANIRVWLDNKGGNNSQVGITANALPQNTKTINLDTTSFVNPEYTHTAIVHEFGHAIGLLHEHYSPLAGIKWNKEFVYSELKRTQGWTKEDVDANLFTQLNVSYTQGTTYDAKSIMHYPILKGWTTDGYSINWNNSISAGDQALVAALYPKYGNRAKLSPRFYIDNFTKMDIIPNAAKQGISLFPSFKITTADASGSVYFLAIFYDKDGNAIKAPAESNYNIQGSVGCYRSLVLSADKKLTANKSTPLDFELFIPYSAIPVPSSTEISARFIAFLKDGDEWKPLYSSEAVKFKLVK
ncbi:MAG: M12 family metallopeptidase [Bacteroidetes bacterium]|nr:M12 family metallopeptidase [Bacteroidota bacterium]